MLSCCWDSSRYSQINDSGRSTNYDCNSNKPMTCVMFCQYAQFCTQLCSWHANLFQKHTTKTSHQQYCLANISLLFIIIFSCRNRKGNQSDVIVNKKLSCRRGHAMLRAVENFLVDTTHKHDIRLRYEYYTRLWQGYDKELTCYFLIPRRVLSRVAANHRAAGRRR